MPPFQNVIATYIGVALYILLYAGYTLYEWVFLKKSRHFVPLLEVDLDTDAVWKRGEGHLVRERDVQVQEAEKAYELATTGRRTMWLKRVLRHVY